MPLIPFNRAQRHAELLDRFMSETNITRVAPGNIARSIADMVFAELEAIEDRLDESLSDINPISATGPYLRLWMEFLGIEEDEAKVAHAIESDRVQKLYVASGTFGDLNEGQDIEISASSFRISGTTRQATGTEVIDIPVEYRIPEDIVLSAADSEQWITLVAMQPGDEFNIAAGQLESHNFTDYVTSDNSDAQLLTTNIMPIVNGEPGSSEDTYQYEVSRAMTFRGGSVIDKINSVIGALPGVTRVIEFEGAQAGVIDFYVDTESFVIPLSVLEAAQAAVDAVAYPGVNIFVNPVPRVGIAINTGVRFKSGVSDEDKRSVIRTAEALLLGSILSTSIGDALEIGELYRQLALNYPEVSQFGTGSNFDQIIVYRDGIDGRRHAEQLNDERKVVALFRYERLLPEGSIPSPIRIQEV